MNPRAATGNRDEQRDERDPRDGPRAELGERQRQQQAGGGS